MEWSTRPAGVAVLHEVAELGVGDREEVLRIMRRTGVFRDHEIEFFNMMFGVCRRAGPCELRLFGVRGDGATVMGFVAYGLAPLTDGTMDISWLAVDPDCQGEGVGAALIEHVCDDARRIGARQVVVETSSTERYERARRAYGRMGFEEVSRVPNYYQDGDDRIILVRKL